MEHVILHHYWFSPFAEKVRLILGYKGVRWRSVVIPDIMPKPDLVALTGGYRRTPVLQIGADVHCDTKRIADVLEQRVPVPTLYPEGTRGVADIVNSWAERVLWPVVVQVAFGADLDSVPKAFLDDRAKLTDGRMTAEGLRFVFPGACDQLRAHLDWLERQLGDGRPFLLSDAPSLADFATAPLVAFLSRRMDGRENVAAGAALAQLTHVPPWIERMLAIGHGRHAEMAAEEAIAIARREGSTTATSADAGDMNRRQPGDRVMVMPDDYGRDPVVAEIVEHLDARDRGSPRRRARRRSGRALPARGLLRAASARQRTGAGRRSRRGGAPARGRLLEVR